MAVLNGSDDARLLRKMVPLTTFPSEAFAELCADTTVERVNNDYLFKRGDVSSDLVYLLEGSVTLQADGLVVDVIHADSESGRFALAHQVPRKIDAFANGSVRIVRLNAEKVNNPPPATYQPKQGLFLDENFRDDADDWMTTLLKLPLFYNIPPSNLQKIIISLKLKHLSVGEVIIEPNLPVDNFYIITKGQCLLRRVIKNHPMEQTLSAGDSFGEEYLCSQNISQETVTALTEVSLLQLDKQHFLSDLKKPLVKYIALEEVAEALHNGAVMLDVRLPSQFENQNMTGSANIPLMALRLRLMEIPKDKTIIVICANGSVSETAAFLMVKNALNALVLKGGIGIKAGQESDHEADSSITAQEDPLKSLSDENHKLKNENQMLMAKIAQLKSEKDTVAAQNKVLIQQIDRLKEILNRFTRSR